MYGFYNKNMFCGIWIPIVDAKCVDPFASFLILFLTVCKMVHLYSAFNPRRFTFSHSHTHSYTDGGGNHARHQPTHREQLGVQSLAQGLFNTNPPWGSPGLNWEPSGNPPCSKDGFSIPEPLSPRRDVTALLTASYF